jgi:hypothetical protein
MLHTGWHNKVRTLEGTGALLLVEPNLTRDALRTCCRCGAYKTNTLTTASVSWHRSKLSLQQCCASNQVGYHAMRVSVLGVMAEGTALPPPGLLTALHPALNVGHCYVSLL